MLNDVVTIGCRTSFVVVIATTLAACAARSPFDDRGPPAPDAPFQDPALEPIERTLREMQTHPAARDDNPDVADAGALPAVPAAPTIDPDHAYTLAELIDIAERNHPTTRAVWERARQAALAIGLVDGAYQPMLAASVNAGYERAVFPIPTFPPVINDSNFSAQTADIVPGLQLSWLLYDFGRREAAENAARSGALAASASFNEQHQRVAQAVTDTTSRLVEWIEFHLLVGFDHIYVYDNTGAHTNETSLESTIFPRFLEAEVTRIDWVRFCNDICLIYPLRPLLLHFISFPALPSMQQQYSCA